MFAQMIVEMTLSRKRFPTSLDETEVRLLARMRPQMSLEVSLFIKTSVTVVIRTHKWFVTSLPKLKLLAWNKKYMEYETYVSLQVDLEALRTTVGLVATFVGAYVGLDLHVSLHMVCQMAFRHEGL